MMNGSSTHIAVGLKRTERTLVVVAYEKAIRVVYLEHVPTSGATVLAKMLT
jgi:hypothetical protein